MDCPIYHASNVSSLWEASMWLGPPLRMNPIGLLIVSKEEEKEDPAGGGDVGCHPRPVRLQLLLLQRLSPHLESLMLKPCMKTVFTSLEAGRE